VQRKIGFVAVFVAAHCRLRTYRRATCNENFPWPFFGRGCGIKRIVLTSEQAAEMEPLLHEAYQAGGSVFAQVQRAAFPDRQTVIVSCHFIPPESSKRLRAFLTKEAERITKTNQPKK
jgi:hypothetical protein